MAAPEPAKDRGPNSVSGSAPSPRISRFAIVSFVLSLVSPLMVLFFFLTLSDASPAPTEATLLITEAALSLVASGAAVIIGSLAFGATVYSPRPSPTRRLRMGLSVAGVIIGVLGGGLGVIGVLIALLVVSCVGGC